MDFSERFQAFMKGHTLEEICRILSYIINETSQCRNLPSIYYNHSIGGCEGFHEQKYPPGSSVTIDLDSKDFSDPNCSAGPAAADEAVNDRFIKGPMDYRMSVGWQTAPRKGVTLPQFLQEYFILATIGEHTCRGSPLVAPQYSHI